MRRALGGYVSFSLLSRFITSEMFLVVKTFGSNNRNVKKKVGYKDVYNVDIRTPGNYTYWDFEPADAKDFKKRTYYGEIIGDNMVLCYILLMSGKCVKLSF